MGTLALVGAIYPASAGANTLVFNESFVAGLGNSVTFVRATTATNEDFEPLLKTIPISGSRHEGARGVYNLFSYTGDFAHANWSENAATKEGEASIIGPDGDTVTVMEVSFSSANASIVQNSGLRALVTGKTLTTAVWVRTVSGSDSVRLRYGGTFSADIAISETWKRIAYTLEAPNEYVHVISSKVGSASGNVYIYKPQTEDVTGQANQNPSEYVSVGVLSSPYHGANIDGLKYFDTYNGNTFGTDLVTGGSDYTDPAWTTTNYTITANAGTAPDGTTTADDVKCDSDGSNLSQSSITMTSGATHTLESYVHVGTTGSHDWVRLTFSQDDTTDAVRAWFDLSNDCAVGFTGKSGGATLDSAGSEILEDGWYRIWLTGDIGANTAGMIFTQNQTADAGFTEETTNSVWWWGTRLYEHDNVVAEATGYDIPAATTKGLLIEEARTNLLTQSDDIAHADWTVVNATIAADDATAPDGSITADKITDDSTNATHSAYQTKTGLTANDIYTSSFYAKAGTKDFISIKYYGAIEGRWALQVYDLSDGTLGESDVGSNSGTIHDAGIEAAGNGWYKCWLAASVNNTTVLNVVQLAEAKTGNTISTFGSISYVGTSQTAYTWRQNMQLGAFPTSDIKTTTTAVTRDKEEAEVALTLDTNDITIACDWTPMESHTQTKYILVSESDASNYLWLFHSGFINTINFRKRVSGANKNASGTLAITAGTTYRLVCRLSSSAGVDIWVDGVKGTGNANTDDVTSGDTLYLGQTSANTSQRSMAIKNLAYYSEAKSDTDCAAL